MLLRGFVGGLLVLVGSLTTTTLPASTPIMKVELLIALRESEAGRMAGLTLVMVGLGLLAASWLSLCRHAAEVGEDAVVLVRSSVLVWTAPLLLAPPLFSRDGWSYAAQGAIASAGASPYDVGPAVLKGPIVQAVDPRWMDTIAPYGPVPLWLGSLGADITGNPWVLVIGHRLVALVGLVLLAWAVPRLARWTGTNPALASAIVLVSPLMVTNGIGGLHNDLLMVGLMAAALVVAVERGWVAGAAVAGASAAVKAPGGLVCVAIVLVSLPVAATVVDRLRRTAAVGAVSVGTLLALGLVTGIGSGWVSALGVPGSVVTPISLTGMADSLFGSDFVRPLGTLVSLVLAAWVTLRRPTGDRAEALRSIALVMGVAVVLSPVVHLWYLLWAMPFIAALRLPRVGLAGLLAASVAFGLAAPLDSSLHGAYLAILWGSLILTGLVVLLLLTRRSRERIERIVSAEWIPA